MDYASRTDLPVVVKYLCYVAAVEGGTGDGNVLHLDRAWAERMQAELAPNHPGIAVERIVRNHLGKVCRVIFDIDELYPPVALRPRSARKQLSPTEALAVFAKDGYQCVHCGTRDNLTVDHIHPVSSGGTNDPDNLQTLCRSCNSRKGAR